MCDYESQCISCVDQDNSPSGVAQRRQKVDIPAYHVTSGLLGEERSPGEGVRGPTLQSNRVSAQQANVKSKIAPVLATVSVPWS